MPRPMPWFKLYAADFLADTNHLSPEACGAHVRLLCQFWRSGPLPVEADALARRAGLSLDGHAEVIEELETLWTETDAGLVPVELEDAREAAERVSEARAEAGRRGGRASAAARRKQATKQRRSKAPATVEPDGEGEAEGEQRETSPLPPAGGKPAAGAGGRKPATGPNAELIRWFETAWLDRRGTEYEFQGPKDGTAVAWLLKRPGGLQEVRARALRMLDSPDPWLAQNASLAVLRSKWNALAVEVRRLTRQEQQDIEFETAARNLAARQGGMNGHA